ncbi:MAG: type II toxin-antitoxin system VapB family antitoxin [Bacteroidota bacterium]
MQKRTNIVLDTELVQKAMELTQLSTLKDVVHHALEEVIKMKERKKMLELKGKVDWSGSLDDMRSL